MTRRALNEGRKRRILSAEEVRSTLARRNGHPGSGVLARLLESESGDSFARSDKELILGDLLVAAGLHGAERNRWKHGHELDFFWPELDLNLELDGYPWHSTRDRNIADRERNIELSSRGVQVQRISYDQLGEPLRLAAHLGAIAALARAGERR